MKNSQFDLTSLLGFMLAAVSLVAMFAIPLKVLSPQDGIIMIVLTLIWVGAEGAIRHLLETWQRAKNPT